MGRGIRGDRRWRSAGCARCTSATPCRSGRVSTPPTPTYDGEDVTWHADADGYRLPTETEWEFACRAGSTGPHYGPLAEIAWTAADGVRTPQNVGALLPNLNGLFDMLGNVWEWCGDLLDPDADDGSRACRGGGYAHAPGSVHAAARRGGSPRAQYDDVGFRVARSL